MNLLIYYTLTASTLSAGESLRHDYYPYIDGECLCHPEQSEEFQGPSPKMLRSAQSDRDTLRETTNKKPTRATQN